LNSGDKARHFAVVTGKGAPADADDVMVTDIHTFQVGSQYTDITNKKLYIRMAAAKAAADWTLINA